MFRRLKKFCFLKQSVALNSRYLNAGIVRSGGFRVCSGFCPDRATLSGVRVSDIGGHWCHVSMGEQRASAEGSEDRELGVHTLILTLPSGD